MGAAGPRGQAARAGRSQRLGHMTGRNWFFVALAAHARTGGGELREWLGETQAASRYHGRVFCRTP